MPCRLPVACFCCLVLVQAEARIAPSADGLPESRSRPAELPLQQQPRRREPGPASLAEAVEIAIERYGGRATKSETVERNGRRVHEIRLYLEDGSVRTVLVDPETGAILPPQER
jgi:uncharacterized membrane protein YkoI